MNVTYSRSIGVCVFDTATGDPKVVFAPTSTQLDPELDRHYLSLADDWKVTESGVPLESTLQTARDAFYVERARALVQICVSFGETELSEEILAEVEHELATRVPPESLLARLMLAPLVDAAPVDALAKEALSLGFGATGHALNRVFELQPLLRRLTAYWLSLSDELFVSYFAGRQELWGDLVTSGVIPALLDASDRKAFVRHFEPLIFAESNVTKRKAIISIANELAARLQLGDQYTAPRSQKDDEPSDEEESEPDSTPTHVAFRRAISQVDAVVQLVSEGKDQRAIRILDQLLENQAKRRSDIPFATKSLCNIAKQCADLFRTDFERTCLERAIELDPSDDWTEIQFGDHLKRVGEYERAEKVLSQVVQGGGANARVAASALADVYARRDEFDAALAMYKEIPNWESIVEVRTAIADILRRKGLFDAAREAYEQLESEGLATIRSRVGKAEIAKRLGDLPLAETIYRDVIPHVTEPNDLRVYRLALVGVLKQQHKVEEAYKIVESVIEEYPFYMPAKLLRAAILGLMDQDQEALESIPDRTPHAYREWLQQYYRGLLLLKLRRYEDAKARLLENLDSALLNNEERDILRLAAAHALLAKEETVAANELLAKINPVRDRYVDYLVRVLKLHAAVALRDQKQQAELLKLLKDEEIEDENLSSAVRVLERGETVQALRFEIKALLALAA